MASSDAAASLTARTCAPFRARTAQVTTTNTAVSLAAAAGLPLNGGSSHGSESTSSRVGDGKLLGKHPENGADIRVRRGRYGLFLEAAAGDGVERQRAGLNEEELEDFDYSLEAACEILAAAQPKVSWSCLAFLSLQYLLHFLPHQNDKCSLWCRRWECFVAAGESGPCNCSRGRTVCT